MVTDTLHNIVLTEIKIHNMHRSLAFPLDGIRKLVCGKVKNTSDIRSTQHHTNLSTATVDSLKQKISRKEALQPKEKVH